MSTYRTVKASEQPKRDDYYHVIIGVKGSPAYRGKHTIKFDIYDDGTAWWDTSKLIEGAYVIEWLEPIVDSEVERLRDALRAIVGTSGHQGRLLDMVAEIKDIARKALAI